MPNKLSASLSVPSRESSVIQQVADAYKLSPIQTKMLYTIRKVENGGPGKEFGVLNPEAMRFAANPDMSFKTQAMWAAGGIKKHFDGTNLEEFSKRYAPVGADNDPQGLNKNWLKNAKYYMGALDQDGQ